MELKPHSYDVPSPSCCYISEFEIKKILQSVRDDNTQQLVVLDLFLQLILWDTSCKVLN